MMAVAPFLKRTPKIARMVYNIFPFVSFLFVALTILSFIYLAWGGYNFALYGNCNGPGSQGFCVFDPDGPGTSGVPECTEVQNNPDMLIVPTEEQLAPFKVFNPEGDKTVVFIGCYGCKYTRDASTPLLNTMAKRHDVKFIIVDFPLSSHNGSLRAANAANCFYDSNAQDSEKFFAYAKELYTADLGAGLPASTSESVKICAESEQSRVTAGKELGIAIGVYGTPTYFINGKAYVGPLNERSLSKLIGK
jgi:protein-disulfide isomerase